MRAIAKSDASPVRLRHADDEPLFGRRESKSVLLFSAS